MRTLPSLLPAIWTCLLVGAGGCGPGAEAAGPADAANERPRDAGERADSGSEPEGTALAPAPAAAPEPEPEPELRRRISVYRGDLDEVLERRHLRVLVPYARPLFFIDEGEPRGIAAELFREYAFSLEDSAGLRRGDLTVLFVPCELDAAVPWLLDGLGDVVAGGLTVTPERAARVAFTDPLVRDVAEIVVTSAASPAPAALEDLAGETVWVAAGSSYAGHLRARSAELEARGLAPVDVVEAPSTLSTEALLEMVHAGILPRLVCDAYKAELWARELPGLRLHPDVVVHAGGQIAWAVRPGNGRLLESLDAFVAQARKGTLLGNVLLKRYLGSTRWIEHPTDDAGRARLEQYAAWIRAAADEHGFDWVRIAAQCFQESRLDPEARSDAGAVGLMQLLPSTARDMGCEDPLDPEQSLRAGVRYQAWLREHYFSDPGLEEVERTNLVLAAYNAGPGRVRRWREAAPDRGLDPDRWRGHVELLALEDVGVQPLHYVDNIEKYYVAYTLALDLERERARVREAVQERTRARVRGAGDGGRR